MSKQKKTSSEFSSHLGSTIETHDLEHGIQLTL